MASYDTYHPAFVQFIESHNQQQQLQQRKRSVSSAGVFNTPQLERPDDSRRLFRSEATDRYLQLDQRTEFYGGKYPPPQIAYDPHNESNFNNNPSSELSTPLMHCTYQHHDDHLNGLDILAREDAFLKGDENENININNGGAAAALPNIFVDFVDEGGDQHPSPLLDDTIYAHHPHLRYRDQSEMTAGGGGYESSCYEPFDDLSDHGSSGYPSPMLGPEGDPCFGLQTMYDGLEVPNLASLNVAQSVTASSSSLAPPTGISQIIRRRNGRSIPTSPALPCYESNLASRPLSWSAGDQDFDVYGGSYGTLGISGLSDMYVGGPNSCAPLDQGTAQPRMVRSVHSTPSPRMSSVMLTPTSNSAADKARDKVPANTRRESHDCNQSTAVVIDPNFGLNLDQSQPGLPAFYDGGDKNSVLQQQQQRRHSSRVQRTVPRSPMISPRYDPQSITNFDHDYLRHTDFSSSDYTNLLNPYQSVKLRPSPPGLPLLSPSLNASASSFPIYHPYQLPSTSTVDVKVEFPTTVVAKDQSLKKGRRKSKAADCGEAFLSVKIDPSAALAATAPKIPSAFICQYPGCGKAFSRPYNLKSHARTHTTERPYACATCGQSFSRQHDMKRHSKLHLGIKPYGCQTCNRSFARMDALNRHLKVAPDGSQVGCSTLFSMNRSFNNASAPVTFVSATTNNTILNHTDHDPNINNIDHDHNISIDIMDNTNTTASTTTTADNNNNDIIDANYHLTGSDLADLDFTYYKRAHSEDSFL